MGGDVIPPVGYGRRQIGNLQRSGQHLALPDGNRYNREGAPAVLAIYVVVIVAVGYETATLARQVDTQPIAIAHRNQVVFPDVEGFGGRLVLGAVVDHRPQPVTEKGIARSLQGRQQREGRCVAVTTHLQPTSHKTVVAGIERVLGNNTLVEEDEPLRGFEGRTRRIGRHQSPVVERLVFVAIQFQIVLATLPAHQHRRVVGGTRHHGQNLTRRGLDSHDSPYLVLHQLLAIGLQLDIDRELQVLARHRSHVVAAILIPALDAPVSVAQENLHPLLATQHLLVGTLDTQVARVVAPVVVVVLLHITGRNLTDIAQHIGRYGIGILPEHTVLNKEAGEAIELLLQTAIILSRELCHECLRRIGGVTGIEPGILHILHALVKLLASDTHRAAEVERIERSHLAHNHHHVVGRLVEHQQLAVAVIDKSARRILCLFEESVAIGILLVIVVKHLQRKETHDIDAGNRQHDASDYIFAFGQFIIFSHVPSSLSYPCPKLPGMSTPYWPRHARRAALY